MSTTKEAVTTVIRPTYWKNLEAEAKLRNTTRSEILDEILVLRYGDNKPQVTFAKKKRSRKA